MAIPSIHVYLRHHFEQHIVESRRRWMSENLPRQTLINTSPHLRRGELSRITVMMILGKNLENYGFDHYDSDPDDDPDRSFLRISATSNVTG